MAQDFESGVQLQGFRGFRHHSVSDLLEILTTAYGTTSTVDEVLTEFQLHDLRRRQFDQLSGGERQRVALAAAACGGPQLLLLDEPTSDMDPEFRRFVWAFLANRSSLGITTIFSTHQIMEVSQICHRIVIMNEGRIIADGTVSELTRNRAGVTKMEVSWSGEHKPPAVLVELARRHRGSIDTARRTIHLTLSGFEQVALVLQQLHTIDNLAVRADQGTLEDVYFELMGR